MNRSGVMDNIRMGIKMYVKGGGGRMSLDRLASFNFPILM